MERRWGRIFVIQRIDWREWQLGVGASLGSWGEWSITFGFGPVLAVYGFTQNPN